MPNNFVPVDIDIGEWNDSTIVFIRNNSTNDETIELRRKIDEKDSSIAILTREVHQLKNELAGMKSRMAKVTKQLSYRSNFPTAPAYIYPRPPVVSLSCKIFVGNLNLYTFACDLTNVFKELCVVKYAIIVEDKEGHSRGYGFVFMSTVKEVDEAVALADGAVVDGCPIKVSRCKSGRSHQLCESEVGFTIDRRICSDWQAGGCYRGVCHFAHGYDDIHQDENVVFECE